MKNILILITLIVIVSCSNSKKSEQIISLNNIDSSIIKKSIETIKYLSVKIGEQEWMQDNLAQTSYRNGDPIPEATTVSQWEMFAKNKEGCFGNFGDKKSEYGFFYNWYAVNDPRGLAPNGWHIPSDKEWMQLVKYLGGINDAPVKLKSTFGWMNNGNGNNSTRFTAIPTGDFSAFSNSYFSGQSMWARWWTTTEIDDENFERIYNRKQVYSFIIYSNASPNNLCKLVETQKFDGLTIRCINDNSKISNDTTAVKIDNNVDLYPEGRYRVNVYKSYFYDDYDTTRIRKDYLNENDEVVLRDHKNGLAYVQYVTPKTQIIEGCIKIDNLQSINH